MQRETFLTHMNEWKWTLYAHSVQHSWINFACMQIVCDSSALFWLYLYLKCGNRKMNGHNVLSFTCHPTSFSYKHYIKSLSFCYRLIFEQHYFSFTILLDAFLKSFCFPLSKREQVETKQIRRFVETIFGQNIEIFLLIP